MSENANAIETNRSESVPENSAHQSGGFEARIREYTTKELERGRKRLPPERFEKLVSEVARAWKNLMEERGRIISESRIPNDGTSEETALRDLVKRTVGAHGAANPESDGAVKRETSDKNDASDARGFRVSHGKDGKISAAPEMKAKYEAFMFGGQSFAELSNADIGHVLSYAYSQSREGAEGNPQALEQLKTKLANDPRGLVTIAENWTHSKEGGKSIDRLLQIKANSVSVVKEIRSAFETAISGRVDQYVEKTLSDVKNPDELKRAILDNVRKLPMNDQFFSGIGSAVRRSLTATGNAVPERHQDELRFVADLFLLKTGSARMAVAELGATDPAFAEEIASLSGSRDKNSAAAAKARLEKKYAGRPDKLAAISEAYGLGMANASGTEAYLQRQNLGGPMSPEAATAITAAASDPNLRTPEAERRILEDRAASAELEKHVDGLSELGGYPKTKRAEDYTREELADIARIAQESGQSRYAPLLRAIGNQTAANGEIRRQVVAMAAGISYEEVVRMENDGADLGKMYETAAKGDPYVRNRGERAEAVRTAILNAGGADLGNRSGDQGKSVWEAASMAQYVPVGETVYLDAAGTEERELSYVKTGEGKYRIEIRGDAAYECGDTNLSAHLEMAKLLCEAEIPFLAGISHDLLRVAWLRRGERTDADSGGFADWKKSELLAMAGELLGIPGTTAKDGGPSDAVNRFRKYSQESGSTLVQAAMDRGILDEGGNLRNWETVRHALER